MIRSGKSAREIPARDIGILTSSLESAMEYESDVVAEGVAKALDGLEFK